MQWLEICNIFPNTMASWPVPFAASILPFSLRLTLRHAFGGVVAASDLNRSNSPNRLGITTRPFEKGDPIQTLSLGHLLKTGQLQTKVDVSQGRQRARLLFHNYENMLFASQDMPVNKGQLAMGLSAVVESVHRGLSHTFSAHAITHVNLFQGALPFSKYIKNCDHLYIVTDMLFDDSSWQASVSQAQQLVDYFNLKGCVFLIVRDPMEYQIDLIKEKGLARMLPYSRINHVQHPAQVTNSTNVSNITNTTPDKLTEQNSLKISEQNHITSYSDSIYTENILKQINSLNTTMHKLFCPVHVATANDDISNFIQFLIEKKFRKFNACGL